MSLVVITLGSHPLYVEREELVARTAVARFPASLLHFAFPAPLLASLLRPFGKDARYASDSGGDSRRGPSLSLRLKSLITSSKLTLLSTRSGQRTPSLSPL
jgi:hypothetical protein